MSFVPSSIDEIMSNALKDYYLLDPNVVFLNHGSYGACPRPVFEEYQRWQRELERQPVEFIGRRATALLAEARAKLAAYLNAHPDDLVYFPNPTTAVNMAARSLDLKPGDEVLTTNHEYGAMDRTWKFLSGKIGFKYVRRPIPVPVSTHEEFVEQFWAGVTARTRVVFISHITSATALIFPVPEICRRARERGILCIVDGAHAPGHISLNLDELGADLYTGAPHKWIGAPKGSAFLHARRDAQSWLEPLVVSWGWGDEEYVSPPEMGNSQFVRFHESQGTRDIAAFLATPAAIEFQAVNNWDAVRVKCHALAAETRNRINALTGVDPICPESPEWFGQMGAMRLPPLDVNVLKAKLYDEFRIEVPVYLWSGQPFIRASFQGYNTQADADALVGALSTLLRL